MNFLLKALLFFTLSALVTNQYFGKAYADILILVGAFFILWSNYKGKNFSKIEEQLILFGLIAFLLTLLGFFQQHPEHTRFAGAVETQFKSLIPLLILPILYYLKITNIKFLVNSILIAAITAGLITLFIDIPSEMPRYHRTHGKPIIFGDLAMLFGLLSLSFSFLYYKKEQYQFVFLIVGGILGITASLYSGSRGGWIALLTVPLLFILMAPKNQRKYLILSTISAFIVIVSIVFGTDNPVHQRIDSALLELEKLVENPNWAGGSLGSRLAFFKVAISAFLANPVFGIGIGEFYSYKMNIIQSLPENFPQWLIKYKHSHNEYLGILSGMGLVGVLFYMLFFGWLIRTFKKAINSDNQQIKAIGLAGLSLVFCYLDFSLSESFLSSKLGSVAFYLLITYFIYYLNKFNNK
jgi:O-antigen ligase